MTQLVIDVLNVEPGSLLLAPTGMMTPHEAVSGAKVEGARTLEVLMEPELRLAAMLLEAEAPSVRLIHRVSPPPIAAAYPEPLFVPRSNRYTDASHELVVASREIVAEAGGGAAGIRALVAAAEARFSYAHPETRFNEGSEQVPYLSCGLTPGSCIDINTYLVASLRACGYEAGYLYGYFFAKERKGRTSGLHCWVVTRHEGKILEWDIAHHMKAGLGATRPGLNPRPGQRVALGHSQGHSYKTEDGGKIELKMLAEPLLHSGEGCWGRTELSVCWGHRASCADPSD